MRRRRKRDPVEVLSIEEYQALVAREMPEEVLLASVVQMARNLGWIVYHAWRSDHSEAGFPDLVCIRRMPDRVLVAELKREGMDPTPAQRTWLGYFEAVGVPAFVWRPGDWLDGTIEAVLRGR